MFGCAAIWAFWLLVSKTRKLISLLNEFYSRKCSNTLPSVCFWIISSFFFRPLEFFSWINKQNIIFGISNQYLTHSGWCRQPVKADLPWVCSSNQSFSTKPTVTRNCTFIPINIPNWKLQIPVLRFFSRTVRLSQKYSVGVFDSVWFSNNSWLSRLSVNFWTNCEYFFKLNFAAAVAAVFGKKFWLLLRFNLRVYLSPYVISSWLLKPKISISRILMTKNHFCLDSLLLLFLLLLFHHRCQIRY